MIATNPISAPAPAPSSASTSASAALCHVEAETLSRIRPQPIVDEEFVAMWIKDDGTLRRFATQPSFEECRDHALLVSVHGMKFAVRRTHLRTGAVTMHVFQVKKQARPIYPNGVRVQPLYAEELAVLRVVEGVGR